MEAKEIIDLVITRHEEGDSSEIRICEGLHLEPMLNYSGKMARNAYWQYKKNWHKDRKYIGILDHKIMDRTGKMEHSKLLARSLGKVRIESIRAVYDGGDPFEITDGEELELLCDIQCSLIEQEVNWGIHDFQQRTHFGYPEMNVDYMRNAVPRDFFLLFFERCDALIKEGKTVDESLEVVAEPQKEHSTVASKIVLMPPRVGSAPNVRLREEFLPYLRSKNVGNTEFWINPFLARIEDLCENIGPNPNFLKFSNLQFQTLYYWLKSVTHIFWSSRILAKV